MKFTQCILTITLLILSHHTIRAQVDEDQLGSWYMYVFNTSVGDGPWGVQGDIQYRDWQLMGDMQQLLLRSGLTYRPESSAILLTLGYGHITSGTFGEDDGTVTESRIYQEALYPTKINERIMLNHRLRYEQRFIEGQDFRTRYRYNLFVTIPLVKDLSENGFYLALYNEIFINGQKDTGDGNQVERFDRNRFYTALGYQIRKGLKAQVGIMNQSTDEISKNQLQFSLHHKF